jgi:drug/metabolite transporter (DMT)-like permease
LIPVFGLLFSVVLLGETIGVQQAIGSVLVVGSMVVLALVEAGRPRGRRTDEAPGSTAR